MKIPRNPWPIGIVLTLLLFFAGTIGLVVMACNQMSDLVSPNYYEDEVRFQKQMDRVERVSRLEAKARVTYNAAARQIRIALPAGHAGAQGSVQLYRPSAAGLDRQWDLRIDANGVQCIDTTGLRTGLWKVRVNWTVGGSDYFLDQKVVVGGQKS